MDWKHSPEKRNREDKIKDIKLGQLESKLNARLNKDQGNKRVFTMVMLGALDCLGPYIHTDADPAHRIGLWFTYEAEDIQTR